MSGFPIKNLLFGVAGGVVGGVVGLLLCKWLATLGPFYAVVLPGALVGLGFGFAAQKRHLVFGLLSAAMGLLAGLLTQWIVYSNESSFFNLVGQLKDYSPVTWVLLGLGVVFAFSFGLGRDRLEPNPSPKDAT
jgi:hypothetical protein